jgi:hypothetical protein
VRRSGRPRLARSRALPTILLGGALGAGCVAPVATGPGLVVPERADWSAAGEPWTEASGTGESRSGDSPDSWPLPGSRCLASPDIAANGPFRAVRWAPDGRRLALVGTQAADRTRHRAAASDVPLQRVLVIAADGTACPPVWQPVGGGGVAWLQDGSSIIAGVSERPQADRLPVLVVDARFGAGAVTERVRVSDWNDAGVGSSPAVCRVSGRIVSVSPDRSRLLVARPDARPPRSNPMEADPAGPWSFDAEHPLVRDGGLADPVWAPDGSGVVFVAGGRLVEVDSVGSRPRSLFGGGPETPALFERVRSPVVNPDLDEVWFVHDREIGSGSIVSSVRRDGSGRVREILRTADDPVAEVRFSPDGAWLAFVCGGRVGVAPNPGRRVD